MIRYILPAAGALRIRARDLAVLFPPALRDAGRAYRYISADSGDLSGQSPPRVEFKRTLTRGILP